MTDKTRSENARKAKSPWRGNTMMRPRSIEPKVKRKEDTPEHQQSVARRAAMRELQERREEAERNRGEWD